MRQPLRFRHFGAAYVLCAVLVLVAPSAVVEGGPLRVDVRLGTTAETMDLAFEDNDSPSATTATTIPRRPAASPVVANASDSAPVRVSIPRIGIDGPVVPVGIADDRQLDVPFAQTAGWYQHSSLPAADGASVLAAHVDFSGQPGLFFNLRLAAIGDLIHIEEPDGTTRTYEVSEVVLYDKTDLPSDDLFRSTGDHALHLVTCGGTFDRFDRSYRGNQVVTALPVT